ncbi:MAG: tetratricopeptide (TPR) repeat protein [Gammaproteobacteria bacterium]|jgi:tetratricopeptide (TPR) repeat protein
MLLDQYENQLSTGSARARDLYIDAVNKLLAGEPAIVEKFSRVINQDPEFAQGYCSLARAYQMNGNAKAAKEAVQQAHTLAKGASEREQSHINCFHSLINGKTPEAYKAIRSHVEAYPRDVLVAQTCTSIMGLIGFSGKPGRESELLAYTNALLPHYGDDWWCLSQHAFSLCETGQIDPALKFSERSLAINPRNAHGAHVRSHIYYESGEHVAGISYLSDWLKDYDKSAILHGHLSWHVALWELGQGNIEKMWNIVDTDVAPGGSSGLPLNILSDTASILYRAQLAGEKISAERWKNISQYAKQQYPNPSHSFIDVHAAITYAMSGDTEPLEQLISQPVGPAAELVSGFAEAFLSIAAQNWPKATDQLCSVMFDHARVGGSRAQRDLLEYMLMDCLLKLGKVGEARRLIVLRRPVQAVSTGIAGL